MSYPVGQRRASLAIGPMEVVFLPGKDPSTALVFVPKTLAYPIMPEHGDSEEIALAG